MKYSCKVEIDRPIEKVAALWANEDYFNKWQDGFQSITLIEGKANTTGTKSKIVYQQGKRKLELIETIITENLPYEKKARYEHQHMINTQTTRFEKISAIKTRFISEVNYTKFNGLMPKLLAKFFPKMFKKQSQKWMNQFKVFAESLD